MTPYKHLRQETKDKGWNWNLMVFRKNRHGNQLNLSDRVKWFVLKVKGVLNHKLRLLKLYQLLLLRRTKALPRDDQPE